MKLAKNLYVSFVKSDLDKLPGAQYMNVLKRWGLIP